MTKIAPHPYRTALEQRDPQALMEALHPDVSFYTPGFVDPVEGRDKVLMLFGVLANEFEDPQIVDELEGQGSRALVFRLSVEGHQIEGVDYLELDENGAVRRITVSMRPLASVQVLADRMRETIDQLTSDQPESAASGG
jgi:hypothetical protein